MFLRGTRTNDMMLFRRQVRAEIDKILAGESSHDSAPSIFRHLHNSIELPPAERSPQRLEDEAVLLTMAGAYSPMLSLMVAHYQLLAHPEIMAELRTELAAHRSATTAAMLERLPYLTGIAQEAHRLTFGLTGRNPRVCPDEAIVYECDQGTCTLPPGTSLSVSTLVIHTDESLFPRPWTFDPSRWLPTTSTAVGANTPIKREQKGEEDALLIRRRRCMLGFMRGPRACIGRHLANSEMAILIAMMARWELELFETDEDDVRFRHDYHVMCPKLGSKGVRVRVKGKWDM
jgi:cytochrome P450